MGINKTLQGDNLPILQRMKSESVSLIYIDPPFNTGREQRYVRLRGGEAIGVSSYEDSFVDYIGFLRARIREAHRILTPNGSLFFHIDWRESAKCRLLLESVFGNPPVNEIIWAYDYGARSRKRWSTKHDTIYWFAKNSENYIFNYDAIDRIPYLAPSLVGAEKAERGKTPTDVWWNTIVPTNGKERTGYATQKPLAILERIVLVHSNEGDTVLDFFAGSGTTGEAAKKHNRNYILIDKSKDAVSVMERRLEK